MEIQLGHCTPQMQTEKLNLENSIVKSIQFLKKKKITKKQNREGWKGNLWIKRVKRCQAIICVNLFESEFKIKTVKYIRIFN